MPCVHTTATTDLKTVEAAIPQEKLHARALEILRGMSVARDDSATADDKAHAEACVTFDPMSLEQNRCK